MLIVASLTVIVLIVAPHLTGAPPTKIAADPEFERPFREAFAKLFFWLQFVKWISAGIFVLVVAAALVMRVRTRCEVRPADETPDLGDRP